MADWKDVLQDILLADGKIDDAETAVLSKAILADDVVDAEEMDFLVALRDASESTTDAFDELFFGALKKHLLADGQLDADEAARVQEILLADGKVDDAEKAFLRDLKASAKKTSPEFDKLFAEHLGA